MKMKSCGPVLTHKLKRNFAGPVEGHMLLVIVDAHSKWPEVHVMDSTTSSKTIQVLMRGLFSHYGIPETLVSDNGPQFTLDEFASLLHSALPPAECLVQSSKYSLKASKEKILLQQRITPTQHKRDPFYAFLTSQIVNTPEPTQY